MGPPEPLKGQLRPSGATRKPPSPAPDPADRGAHPVPGEPVGKSRDEPPASPTLQRYLSNPVAHEMRALRFSTADPPLATSQPGSHKAPSPPGNPATMASQAPVPNTGEPIKVNTSISLSPSPPACPSSDGDTEQLHDLMGLGAAWKKPRNAEAARRRTNRIVRQRKAKQGKKKC